MTREGGEAGDRTTGAYAYRAFISYSHRNQALARKLHRDVETYPIPGKLIGRTTALGVVPRRLRPIFRDREELPASGDLSAELTSALKKSMFLIVICSPAAAKSRWVNEEILQFKRFHGEGRVLAVVAEGEPNATELPGREDEECFPVALRFRMGADGRLTDEPAEPIAADARRDQDGVRRSVQKLVAGLTGLGLDDLVRRETQRRIAQMTAIASLAAVGMMIMGGLAFYANSLRLEANAQRQLAQQEAAAARAASDYLVGTFELSNPATDNPRTITAMTILKRSAERAHRELADQPLIQSRLVGTLARAYNNLGLFDEARGAIELSMPAIQRSGADGAETLLVLATTYAKQGALDKARATVRQAEALLGPDPTANAEARAQAALTEGRIEISASNVKAGIAAFDRALAYYRVADNAPPGALATVLNNKGLLLSDDGQFDAAETSLSQSLTLFRQSLGENHLSTGKAWFSLAQNAFNAGKLKLAKQRISQALVIERRVLDPDNPILGDALSMQGQIQEGLGELPEAERSLTEAVAIYRKAFEGPHFLIGIADVYLGLIESEQGRTDAALATLDDAKKNYDASYGKLHPNHGDLLVNRAKVLAHAGRMAEAKADCASGIAILRQTLGPDASFTKQSSATCASLAAQKQAKL
jgi:tetratricopeptide (TPR) repeat protein